MQQGCVVVLTQVVNHLYETLVCCVTVNLQGPWCSGHRALHVHVWSTSCGQQGWCCQAGQDNVTRNHLPCAVCWVHATVELLWRMTRPLLYLASINNCQ